MSPQVVGGRAGPAHIPLLPGPGGVPGEEAGLAGVPPAHADGRQALKERRLQLCECGNRTVIVSTGGGTIVMCVCIGITMFLQNDRGNVRMWFMDVVRPK